MSRTLEPTKKDVIELAEYLGCNDEELWSEVSRLLKRQDTYARIDAYELLRWKYKELNHQTISKEFLEAYNTLMEETQLKENK